MNRTTRFQICLMAVAATALLAGCSTNVLSGQLSKSQIVHSSEEAAEAGYSDQALILSDGVVSHEEYEQSVDSYVDCVERFGYSVSERVLSPVNNLTYEYSTDFASFDQDDAMKNIRTCNDQFLLFVLPGFTGSHEAKMDAAFSSAIADCLGEKGFQASGNETQARDFDDINDLDLGVFSHCVTESADRLYPDIPSLSVSF